MGRKTTVGLQKRNGVWHIDKRVRDYGRLCESTGESSYEEAVSFLDRRLQQIREELGRVRPRVKWRDAATKYINDNIDVNGKHLKSSLSDHATFLEQLDPFIGDLLLEEVHDASLKPYIDSRKLEGKKTKTINIALGVVRHILNLASSTWRHPNGMLWLENPPKVTMAKPPMGVSDAAKPYPLDFDEQETLISELPEHLRKMALFSVNTSCREIEVCSLQWEFEVLLDVEEFKGRIFIIPGDKPLIDGSYVKNRADRIVVCNDIAKGVIDSCRGNNSDYVFTYKGNPLKGMNNSAWEKAWKRSKLPVTGEYTKGPHNLRHTAGRRLRSVGVSWETRQVIMGHSNGSITTHYSAAEVSEVLKAVQLLCDSNSRKTHAVVLFKLHPCGKQAA